MPVDRSFEEQKLDKLREIEGYKDIDAFLEAVATDAVCPAICCNPKNPTCEYTEEMEPDQTRGYCPECAKNTMKSALILMGVI